ncbi:MAG: MMPL family transporter, partial [Actinobacteria bacterium]|nr:MMPL family transporter [Actinomycetota bacterium]
QSGADPATASANLAALQQTQASLTAQANDLTKQEADLKAQQDELNKEKADLEAQQADLQKQADALTKQGNELQAQADDLTAQGADLQAQADSLQAQADDLQTQGDQLQAQADDLTAQQTAAEQEQQDALDLQDDLTAQVTTAGGDSRATDPRIVKLQDALATPSGVQRVIPPMVNDAGTAVVISVIATTRPADPATAQLVDQLRTEVIPPALSPGMQADVGGNTANNVDLATVITEKLPLVILTVIGLSFLLLLIAFRSLLIPLQAAITNLLSAAAAFGVVTAVFQWGWGLDLIGLSSPYGTVPIASFVPLMMFAALFGLSMDYEVFFISHVQGLHGKGMAHKDAVRSGLASSAKIISAAALIMIAVFGSFILIDDPIIKQFGVGLSVAVALAALLVLLLAPAMLTLFGERTWQLPKFLDKILPDLDLEGNKRSSNVLVPAGASTKDTPGSPPE